MTPNEVLLKASALLSERGWCQKTLQKADGRVCATGAICTAAYGNAFAISADDHGETAMRAAKLLCAHLGLPEDPSGPGMDIPTWNDAPERTAEDVILAMKRAAER